jgi:hypothetical protein
MTEFLVTQLVSGAVSITRTRMSKLEMIHVCKLLLVDRQ